MEDYTNDRIEMWIIRFNDGVSRAYSINAGDDIMDNARQFCAERGNISIYEIESITRMDTTT